MRWKWTSIATKFLNAGVIGGLLSCKQMFSSVRWLERRARAFKTQHTMFIHFRFTTKSKDYTGNFFSSGIWGNSLSTIQMVPNCERHFKAFQGTTSSLGSFQLWRKSHLRTSSSLGLCSFYVFRPGISGIYAKGFCNMSPQPISFQDKEDVEHAGFEAQASVQTWCRHECRRCPWLEGWGANIDWMFPYDVDADV